MALTNASRLADFGTGIGTQGAILQVDNADQMVGIGTTDPTAQLEVKQDFKVGGASTITGALTVSGDLTASGNVTIGGTLTYEDVTNIDSVGLITARSGVRVTAGGVVVTAGVSTFTDDVKVNSTLTATEGINVTAGVTTIAGTSTFAKATTVNATLTASEGINVSAGVGTFAGDVSIADQIIHTGDTNTAIRFPAADQVKITTAGGNRLHITENGKIGVGGDPTAYPGKFVVIGASGGASGILCDREIISRISSGVALTERGFQQIIDGVEKFAVYPDYGGNFKLDVGSTRKNAVTINGDNQVGVGTTTPASGAKLHLHDESTAVRMQFTNSNTGISDSDGVRLMIDSSNNFEILQRENANIEFFTNNSQRAVLTNSGTLGINETSPDSNFKLEVNGMGKFTNNVAMNDGKMMYWGDSDTSFILGYDAAAGGYLAFGSNNERMRLLNTGRLGIGITDPSHELQVAKSGNTVISAKCTASGSGANAALRLESADSSSDWYVQTGNDASGGLRFYSGSERMRLTSAGKLVIGTTQAHATLVSRSAHDTKQFAVQNSTSESGSFDNETGIWFKGHQSQDDERYKAAIIHQCTADYGVGDLVICVDGAADNGNATIANDEVMRISADLRGRFGANDFTGGSSDTARFKIASTTNEVYTLALTERGGQCLALSTRIDGAGSSTNAVRFFDGPGIASVATINVSASTVTYGTGSDYRMKENQVDISDGITRVKQLKPYRFNWKSEYGGGDKVDGFFAHEVSPVVPNAVKGDKDAVDSDGNIIRQQIDQAKLVPVLTAALQEAIAKIETLEARLDAAGL